MGTERLGDYSTLLYPYTLPSSHHDALRLVQTTLPLHKCCCLCSVIYSRYLISRETPRHTSSNRTASCCLPPRARLVPASSSNM